MSIQNNTPQNDTWKGYQERAALKPANPYLTEFISSHKGEIKSAVELGCGALSDSIYLASQGIKTLGVDGRINSDLVNNLLGMQPQGVKDNLTLQQQTFENLSLPKTDLVYSFASLPFCEKSQFGNMLSQIVSSINPNGYILAQFFDQGHPFTIGEGKATGFSKEQLESVFSYLGFEVSTTQWQSTQNQLGERLPNMNNILITGKAPEVLPEFNVDTINQLLGLTPEQIETHNDVLSHYGLAPAESLSTSPEEMTTDNTTQANEAVSVSDTTTTDLTALKVNTVPPPIDIPPMQEP